MTTTNGTAQKTEESAADKYRRLTTGQETPVVDVNLPSGAVFKFRKPSKFAVLFAAGELPQAAASAAVQAWKDSGAMQDMIAEASKPDREKMFRLGLAVRDRVLMLSVDPKIVVGVARPGTNELSTDEIADDDLAFLFKWVAGGGEASALLATFPGGRKSNAMASASRPKRGRSGK